MDHLRLSHCPSRLSDTARRGEEYVRRSALKVEVWYTASRDDSGCGFHRPLSLELDTVNLYLSTQLVTGKQVRFFVARPLPFFHPFLFYV